MAPEHDGWDPENPEMLSATGLPKKQGGWQGWAVALASLTVAAIAWAIWGRE